MRNSFFLVVVLAVIFLSSCKEEDCGTPTFTVDEAQLATDIQNIQDYLSTNGINAEQHDTGLFYEVVSPGQGDNADDCSTVFVQYEGMLTDGTVFGSHSNEWDRFSMKNLIPGWRIGLPLIKEEGEINLYIPSVLAYGSDGIFNSSDSTYVVPPDAVLIFNMRLLAAENYLN